MLSPGVRDVIVAELLMFGIALGVALFVALIVFLIIRFAERD